MVVMDDADVDLAVEGALFGGFGTAGQRCTSLGTAIVHESVYDEFVEKLSERLASSPIGERRRNAEVALTTIPAAGLDLREHLGNIEKQLIRSALDQTDGTVARAARLLRLQRTTLVEKLRKYELQALA